MMSTDSARRSAVHGRTVWSKSQDVSRIMTLDDICETFGFETLDSYDDKIVDNFAETWAYAKSEALKQGMTEDEAEDAASVAETEERDQCVLKYKDAVLAVAEKLFDEHELGLTPLKGDWRYRLAPRPRSTWRSCAEAIRETVNGVGYFYFRDLGEFMSSGPWTACQVVMHHLGYVRRWPEVYGEGTAKSMLERARR